MRAQVLKQNQSLIQKLHFLFMKRGRIRLTQIISGALKLKMTKFLMNFRRNLPYKDPIHHQKPIFFILPPRYMS